MYLLIVQRKLLKAVQAFATTVKRWNYGTNTDRKIQLWIWQQPWALSFDGTTASGAAEVWRFRYEDVELGENTF
jgi:hypothetical protein